MPTPGPRPLFLLSAMLVGLVAIGVMLGAANSPSGSAVAGTPPASTADGSGQTPSTSDPDATSTPRGSHAPATLPPPTSPLAKSSDAVSAAPGRLRGYVWPLRNALITSRFAPRAATDGGFAVIDGVSYHDGLDLATQCGDNIHAAHDGVVLYVGRNFDPYLGYLGDASEIYARLERLGRTDQQPIVIVIDDGNGYRSVYVHLKVANVEAGVAVNAGDVIGEEGMTGFSTGCHLHFTLIRMDSGWQGVVPRLAQYGYPSSVRERVDPLDVLPWGDEFAPQRLRDKINPPTPAPSVTPGTSPDSSPAVPSPSGEIGSPPASPLPIN